MSTATWRVKNIASDLSVVSPFLTVNSTGSGKGKCRLQNSRIFCERERNERKVRSESKNGEGEWGETLKRRRMGRDAKKFSRLTRPTGV